MTTPALCGAIHPQHPVVSCERDPGQHPRHQAFVKTGEHTWEGLSWDNANFVQPLQKGKKDSTKLARIVKSLRRDETTG